MAMRATKVRESWVWILMVFTVAALVEAVFWGQMVAFTPLYIAKLGVRSGDIPSWTGAIAAISVAIGLPFLPFWGALADKYARQPIIVRSFVAHLVAGIIAILAHNVWFFLLSRAVMSLSLGNSGLMMTTLTERAPAQRVTLALAIMNTASPVGAFVGPLIGGPIVDAVGFPALLGIDMVLMLVVILGMSFGYTDHFVPADNRPLLAMVGETFEIIWRSARLRLLFPALFLLFAGWMLATTYIPLVALALYHGTQPGTAVGIVVGASGCITVLLGPVMGALADRFGLWRVLFPSVVIEVGLWPLPAVTHDLTSFTIAWILVNGVASSVFALSFSALAGSATTALRGRVMALSYLPVNLGYMVGPAIGSVITQSSLFAIFPTAGVITALGLVVLICAARQRMVASVQMT